MCSVSGWFESHIWTTLLLDFSYCPLFPFISLLVMNSVIIHTLRKRQLVSVQGQCQGHNEGHLTKMRSSEKHIVVMLLLVTFTFLILSTPSIVFSFSNDR